MEICTRMDTTERDISDVNETLIKDNIFQQMKIGPSAIDTLETANSSAQSATKQLFGTIPNPIGRRTKKFGDERMKNHKNVIVALGSSKGIGSRKTYVASEGLVRKMS